LFVWRFLALFNKGSSKTPKKNLLVKVQKSWGFFFRVVFPHRLFLIAFLAVSLHGDPKNTSKACSKTRPKKTQKKVGM
jgi:hypothetical protein